MYTKIFFDRFIKFIGVERALCCCCGESGTGSGDVWFVIWVGTGFINWNMFLFIFPEGVDESSVLVLAGSMFS
jgi:hypothetical protein